MLARKGAQLSLDRQFFSSARHPRRHCRRSVGMKRIKGRKKREDRASHSGVTEEKPVRSSLSFRRSKSRGSESTSGGAVETSSKSLPNFGDFKDLVEDDDERAESDGPVLH